MIAIMSADEQFAQTTVVSAGTELLFGWNILFMMIIFMKQCKWLLFIGHFLCKPETIGLHKTSPMNN